MLAGVLLGAGAVPGTSVRCGRRSSSDIPGVELPGPVAAGRLGGGIYDVVYRIGVAPGHVIVASLTGTAGTDFDIYLFDGSASTVLSDVGLLKKSAGPTSTESISWPSPFGGTYYIDLNGATDVEGDFRLTVQTVPDSTPPSVSMVLAGGHGSTNALTVPVTLAASDDLSGVAEMAFSGDGTTYGAWAPFSTSTTWTFPPGDGSRTLWAKVRNGVALESSATNAKVTIDTDPPAVLEVLPPPGSAVVGLRPTFTVGFDEAIDPATWTNLGLIVQEAMGTLIPGEYVYAAIKHAGTFVPSAALLPGATYVITIGDVRDVAGNRVASSGSWTIVPLAPTDLVPQAGSRTILSGASTRIDLTLSGAPAPAVVEVSYSWSGSGGFVPLATVDVVNGRLSLAVSPALNTRYRFSYAGATNVAPAQVDVPILVRRAVALVGRNSCGHRSRKGRRLGQADGRGRARGCRGLRLVPPVSLRFLPARLGIRRQPRTQHGRRRPGHVHLGAAVLRLVVLARCGGFDDRFCQQHESGLPLVGHSLTGRGATGSRSVGREPLRV